MDDMLDTLVDTVDGVPGCLVFNDFFGEVYSLFSI
jgi:hypothetical protein